MQVPKCLGQMQLFYLRSVCYSSMLSYVSISVLTPQNAVSVEVVIPGFDQRFAFMVPNRSKCLNDWDSDHLLTQDPIHSQQLNDCDIMMLLLPLNPLESPIV